METAGGICLTCHEVRVDCDCTARASALAARLVALVAAARRESGSGRHDECCGEDMCGLCAAVTALGDEEEA